MPEHPVLTAVPGQLAFPLFSTRVIPIPTAFHKSSPFPLFSTGVFPIPTFQRVFSPPPVVNRSSQQELLRADFYVRWGGHGKSQGQEGCGNAAMGWKEGEPEPFQRRGR